MGRKKLSARSAATAAAADVAMRSSPCSAATASSNATAAATGVPSGSRASGGAKRAMPIHSLIGRVDWARVLTPHHAATIASAGWAR